MITASNNPYPSDPDPTPNKLDRAGYVGNALTLDQKIDSNLVEAKALIESFKGTPFLGSIIPTDTPSGTGKSFWLATQSGTYINFGGVVVTANSFAVISRNEAGVFSISQTALDLSSYLTKEEITNDTPPVVVKNIGITTSIGGTLDTIPTTNIFQNTITKSGILKTFYFYSGIVQTVKIKRFILNVAGTDFVFQNEVSVNVVIGWNVIQTNSLSFFVGDYIAVFARQTYGGTAWSDHYSKNTEITTTISKGTLSTYNIHCGFGFEVTTWFSNIPFVKSVLDPSNSKDAPSLKLLSESFFTIDQIGGVAPPSMPETQIGIKNPISGTLDASAGTYIFKTAFTKPKTLKTIYVYSGVSQTIKIKRFSLDTLGTSFVFKNEIEVNVVLGVNTIFTDEMCFSVGDYIGIYSRVNFNTEATWSSYYATTSDLAGTKLFTDFSTQYGNANIQIGFLFEQTAWFSPKKINTTQVGNPLKYGAKFDGVTDDSDAINACILANDHVVFNGNSVALVKKPIIVRTNTWLDLDNNFTIKLGDNSNCALIKNKWAEQAYFMEKNLINGAVPTFMPQVYPTYGTYPSANYVLGVSDKNIKITGGKLDGNGGNQTRQDYRFGNIGYWGVMLSIVNTDGFELSNIKLLDSCTYFTDFSILSNFVIKNIYFDYLGNRENVDGIHFDGECRNGAVENIFGKTNDDMVTFNGGDSWYPKNTGGAITTEANRLWYPLRQGLIENITVKNIFATSGYRATRLLSNKRVIDVSPITETEGMRNIVIDGIYGTFRTDLILISNHYGNAKSYGHITFKNIHANSLGANNITIEACNIDSLVIDGMNYLATNMTGQLIKSEGTIKSLLLSNGIVNANGKDLSVISMINNTGIITKMKLFNFLKKEANYLQTINGTFVLESIMSDFN